MNQTVFGTIHGSTIQLDSNLGLAEGQRVEVSVKVPKSTSAPGDGFRRAAEALSKIWTPEDDEILEEIYRDRKNDRRPEIEP